MLSGAFERILGNPSSDRNLMRKFKKLTKPFFQLQFKGSRRSKPGESRPDAELGCVWFRELHQLRNDYAHGRLTPTKDLAWQPYEHMLLGSYFFPLLLKLVLERDGFYSLTSKDEEKLDVFERRAESEIFADNSGREGREVWPWRTVLADYRMEQAAKNFRITITDA